MTAPEEFSSIEGHRFQHLNPGVIAAAREAMEGMSGWALLDADDSDEVADEFLACLLPFLNTRWQFKIESFIDRPSECTVWRDGVVVFMGSDILAEYRTPPEEWSCDSRAPSN